MKLTKREKKAVESCYTTLSLLYSNNKIPKTLKLDGFKFKLDNDGLHSDLLVLMHLLIRMNRIEKENIENKED